jgi:PhzF family phenazine biosynthesis protein
MSLKLFHVDAFSSRPFGGNHAAVCILTAPRSYIWMQRLAEEMNLSETAFLLKEDQGYNLRWFTPTVEIELCGHGTLASAHVLWEQGFLKPDEEAHFSTLSGWLHATKNDGWIEMDFPSEKAVECVPPKELIRALDVPITFVGQNRFDYFVEVDSETSLRALIPDYQLLRQLPIRGVTVTAKSASPEYDFVSRFFAPAIGINEDPVTGSAHCSLGPYWAERLGKKDLIAFQASRRGGVIRVRIDEDDHRARIAGQAVTVLAAELSEITDMADERRERTLAM